MNYIKNIFKILSNNQRRASIYQIVLMFIAMFFEFFGLGLLVPIIDLLTSGSNKYIYNAFSLFSSSIPTLKSQILLSIFLLAFLNILKMIFVTYQSWSQAKFIFGIKTYLAGKLLKSYINQPYIYHVQTNSAILIKNLTTAVGQFVDGLTSIFILMTDLFLLVGSLLLLIFLYPSLTFYTIIIVGSTLYFYQLVTRKKIKKWWQLFFLNEGTRLQYLNQIFGGIKEIKIYGKESFFFEKFVYYDLQSASAGQYQRVANALPRSFLEMFSIFFISGMLLFMFLNGTPSGSILSAVGILTAAAFRLLPSVYRISSALQNLAFLNPSISQLQVELNNGSIGNNTNTGASINLNVSIELSDVNFSYPTSTGNTLSEINISIPVNTTVGIVGTTGAGKSTLVELILGLIQPSNGLITVNGKSINENLTDWQSRIGYVPQHIYLMDDTIERNIAFGIKDENISKTKIDAAIKAAQLSDFISNLPEGLKTNVGERGVRLSGGQRQRIGIARAIYNEPELLIFDEATSALDTKTENEIVKNIDSLKNGRTIIIITHRIASVKNSDYIYCLEKGIIIKEGTPDYVFID